MRTVTSTKNFNIKRLIHQGGMRYWLLVVLVLAITITACQSSPPATGQWVPPYLKLHLSVGKVQMQWPGDSEWTTLENGIDIAIQDTGRIIADPVEGAQFSTGDGSIFELDPGTVIEVQNPRTFPHLQVTLRDGTLVFTAQKHSYELSTPTCSISLLNIPAQIEIEADGETTRVSIKEGAATCVLEEDILTLPTCYEIVLNSDEDPEIDEFCIASTLPSPPTVTASPSPTPWWPDTTVTPSTIPTLTPPTAIPPTVAAIIIIPPTETSTPLPPPTPTFKPRRATNTPPPPPTSTPKPPPTSTPEPPPTSIPEPTDDPRPTPTPLRPTPSS